MTCAFTQLGERVAAGAGYTDRLNYHLDRMAAYLVAMNGDPDKPEVASTQDRRKYRHDLPFHSRK